MKLAFLVSSLAVGGVSATTPISAVIKLITGVGEVGQSFCLEMIGRGF